MKLIIETCTFATLNLVQVWLSILIKSIIVLYLHNNPMKTQKMKKLSIDVKIKMLNCIKQITYKMKFAVPWIPPTTLIVAIPDHTNLLFGHKKALLTISKIILQQ